MQPDIQALKTEILARISASPDRIAPAAFEKETARTLGVTRKAARAAVQGLMADGLLAYVNELGCTFIEPSFQSPARLSDRVVVAPQGMSFVPEKDDVAIVISPGASFGDGRHPTTRLSLQGIEVVMPGVLAHFGAADSRMLDIGTGSGVLALAALKMGVRRAVGLDTDPCARYEAVMNAALNGLQDRFAVLDAPPEALDGAFCLIAANLRPPTLHAMHPEILGRARPGSAAVLSGMKTEEAPDIADRYGASCFRCVWEKAEKGWSALAFRRRD